MLNLVYPNPYIIGTSAVNLLKEEKNSNPPDLIFTPSPGEGNRYPIRILVIGIPEGVKSVIYELYMREFAQISEWSPPLQSQHPGEIMRVMTRYFFMEEVR